MLLTPGLVHLHIVSDPPARLSFFLELRLLLLFCDLLNRVEVNVVDIGFLGAIDGGDGQDGAPDSRVLNVWPGFDGQRGTANHISGKNMLMLH